MAGSRRLDRRTLLVGLAALPLAACVGEGKPAPRVSRFREVRVDASDFAAKGVPRYAQKVADRLRVAAAGAFAGRLAPEDRDAPVLVIGVSVVRLGSGVGGGFSGFGIDSSLDADTMAGNLTVLSASGATIDRRRHFATSNPASSGKWYLAENEDLRLDALCRLYAAWAAREYPG